LRFGRGHHHDDLADAGHMGRYRIHQNAARVGGFSTRNINAHTVKRRDFLAQQRAVLIAVLPRLAARVQLAHVVATHPFSGCMQGIALLRGDGLERSLQFRLRNFQCSNGIGLQAIKPLRVFEHGSVAALHHVRQDARHTFFNGAVGVGRPMQDALELRLEIGRGGGKLADGN
jgi:hypothetical protein